MKKHQESIELADKVKGFDLNIDESVQKQCDVYNSTSTSTRTIIYVLLVVNVVALIAVVNTHPWNWTKSRLSKADYVVSNDVSEKTRLIASHIKANKALRTNYLNKRSLIAKNEHASQKLLVLYNDYQRDSAKEALAYQTANLRDSVKLSVDMDDAMGIRRNHTDNSRHIAIPLLGNSFDIDDLSPVAGASFLILLIMLRFTLAREKDNLKIALIAISERYVGSLIEDDYYERIKQFKPADMTKEAFAEVVNFKRRRFHYNSLSMSEIFNLPKLEISKDVLQTTPMGRFVKNHLFFFPYAVYFLIGLNDWLTSDRGVSLSASHTSISFFLTVLCWAGVAYVCHSCNYQKAAVNRWFDDFYHKSYEAERAVYVRYRGKRWTLPYYIIYFPAALLIVIPNDIWCWLHKNIGKIWITIKCKFDGWFTNWNGQVHHN